jgi:hypothetical protein
MAAGLGVAAVAFVPGCATEPDRVVPSTAMLTSQGNTKVVYTAPSDGMVYVYDDTSHDLIYSGQMMKGQRLTVDPKADNIEMDDRKVSESVLKSGNEYQVYFDKQPTTVEHHRVVTEERTTERHEVTVPPANP